MISTRSKRAPKKVRIAAPVANAEARKIQGTSGLAAQKGRVVAISKTPV